MNPLKKIIRKLKRRHYKKTHPAINDLDRKLAKYLTKRNGFFVEAGANNGFSQSNTYFLEKKRGWRGVLIEGIPDLYEECKNRRPDSIVKNCALVSNECQDQTVEMHFANLMSVVEGSLKTEEERNEHINAGVKIQNLDEAYSISVPARTLESILDNVDDLPRIDFFSLDVEGGELNVLKGMNLAKYRPEYILVEARYFDEVDAFMVGKDYEMIEQMSHHDFLYKLK